MSRKVNDGSRTGLKQDRFRNSRFEFEERGGDQQNYGMSRKTINTLGGSYQENRGHRQTDEENARHWDTSPFEDGRRVSNWSHKGGWDNFYRTERGFRSHGGALIGHDKGHQGYGPKGYKRSDDFIYEDVCDMLSLSPDVDAREIEVTVKDGVVYLDGSVRDRESKKMAEMQIENISGVHDVQNRLNFINERKDLH